MGVRRATLKSVQRLIRSGKIPQRSIQGKRYVAKDSLDKWIAKNRVAKKTRKQVARR